MSRADKPPKTPKQRSITISTEVAVTQDNDAAVASLLAQQEEEYGDVNYQVPILKLAQALTKEVKAGDAEAGEFINTLTGESYGTSVDFVVSFFQRGRSASSKDGRYYVAIGTDLIPEAWKDLVGEEFVGTRFDEHPDAEERYKERVNSGEIKWEKGPLISTTYNYTGLVIPSAIEGDDGEEQEPLPVRISFLRSTKSAHDKLMTLKKATMRNKPFWDVVFTLTSEVKSFGRNDSFIVNVRKGRPTTDVEKGLAVEVAQAVAGGRVRDNAEQAAAGSAPVAPDAAGGLDV